ncbi:MAG TPA: dTDP-4-dehydrorhamnose 3,5-epimerase [Pyrinomonadaceae bacterium]|nr:dTDP-4-dehydrorhamnose 3,5-epimerase [Pyrinomonadaceae bacterium]
MIITETKLAGALIIEPSLYPDERGFFASVWTEDKLAEHGVQEKFVAANLSYNKKRGTLRGMHYQAVPYGQGKLMSCTRGAVYDVGIDLRPHSATFKQWIGLELTAENRRMLYLPPEFAHGYLTLADDSELSYLVTNVYAPQSSRGVRWNDPAFSVEWPQSEMIMVARDRDYPDFSV